MADEISRVAYYMAAIPHKAGEGARVLTAFKEAGVNLMGCLGYRKTARNAEIVFVLDEKAPGVGAVGKQAGLSLGKKQKAFLVSGEDRPGAVVAERVGERHLGPQQLHAEPLEVEIEEERRQGRHGLDCRADVVVEPRQGELRGSATSAGDAGPLEHLHAQAGACQHERGRQAIGAGSDHDDVRGAQRG